MVKRLLLIGAAVAGVVFLRRKARQQQAEQDLWTQATDDVDTSTAAPAPAAEPVAEATEPVPTPAAPTATDEATTSS
ncbi:DLW-39 family protein [Monashia sp. NPDC004114]